jgi:hypothetical protein
MFVKGWDDVSVDAVPGVRGGALTGDYCWIADKTGMGVRDGTQALIRSRQQVREMRPGTADESFEGQQVRGSRFLGQAVPGVYGSAGGRAQVGIYLTGDVALQAADDLGLGLSFFVRRST